MKIKSNKFIEKLITAIVVLILIVQPYPILASNAESNSGLEIQIQGNPRGVAPIPPEANHYH